MAEVVFILGLLFLYYLAQGRKQEDERRASLLSSAKLPPPTPTPFVPTEEMIFREEDTFYEHSGSNLPDAPNGKKRYVFLVMRQWYRELAGKHRYDDETCRKIRLDWLAYMQNVTDSSTEHWLSFETDEPKCHEHKKEAMLLREKASAIEDGFASALGPDYVAELSRIRQIEYHRFDDEGRFT